MRSATFVSRLNPQPGPGRAAPLPMTDFGGVSIPDDEPDDGRLEAVKALMLKLAAGQSFERLGAIVQEHLFTGGKRLRARLALASLEALDGPAEAGVPWAAACELLHNATLVHDDLQDGDPVRRGRFAVWIRHGQAQAINAGDLLLMLPFIALDHVPVSAEVRWQLARAIAGRAEQTVRGQSLEMCLLNSGRWDWESYAEAATGKTSALMALPVHGSAVLAGRDPDRSEALSNCFKRLGLLFQVQDDVVDLYGDKGRAEKGGDVREGAVTALVVEHLRLHPQDKDWLVARLAAPRDETTDQDVEAVADRFLSGGALDAVIDRIRSIETEIIAAPILLEEPRLQQVALQLVEMSLKPIRHLLK